MSDTKKTQYYALIDNLYYRLFSIEENYQRPNPKNNFIKWSTIIETKLGKNLRTYQRTIHPDIIQLKHILPKKTRLIGPYYRAKNIVHADGSKYEYEPLEVIGYDTLREGIIQLGPAITEIGFWHRRGLPEIDPGDISVNFPDDTYKPYWISPYFTKYDREAIKQMFKHEDINEPLFYEGRRGNVVTLLKFLTPEWEKLKLPRGDDDGLGHWSSPHFQLSRRYHKAELW